MDMRHLLYSPHDLQQFLYHFESKLIACKLFLRHNSGRSFGEEMNKRKNVK